MRRCLTFAVLFILSACASPYTREQPQYREHVLYSLSLSGTDILELSVYNPHEYAVCIGYDDWPGPGDGSGDVLKVVGKDGRDWSYIGLEADPMGPVQQLHIAPTSEAVAHVTIRVNYRPVGSDARIGKVYYAASFHRC